jgi:hypothetical protein
MAAFSLLAIVVCFTGIALLAAWSPGLIVGGRAHRMGMSMTAAGEENSDRERERSPERSPIWFIGDDTCKDNFTHVFLDSQIYH